MGSEHVEERKGGIITVTLPPLFSSSLVLRPSPRVHTCIRTRTPECEKVENALRHIAASLCLCLYRVRHVWPGSLICSCRLACASACHDRGRGPSPSPSRARHGACRILRTCSTILPRPIFLLSVPVKGSRGYARLEWLRARTMTRASLRVSPCLAPITVSSGVCGPCLDWCAAAQLGPRLHKHCRLA